MHRPSSVNTEYPVLGYSERGFSNLCFAESEHLPKSVFSDRYRALLRHVVHARKAAGLTQVELAERLGKPQSFVSKSETGERRIDFVELVECAYALNIDPLDLMQKVLADKSFKQSAS